MEKQLLSFLTWIFILGGLYAFVNGFILLLAKASPAEYGVLGIGGGFWLLSAAIVIYIRSKIN
jgi:hypothetical protein